MALTLKILNAGTLATGGTAAPLYPPLGATQAGKTALVTNIMLVNTDTINAATVNLTVAKQGGADIQISPFNLLLPPQQAFVFDDELTLLVATGPDVVKASIAGTVGTGKVHFVVNGVERDI